MEVRGTGSDIPRPAAGIEIPEPSPAEGSVVVSLPPGRFLALSPASARLLRLMDGRRDLATLAALVSGPGASVSPEALREHIETVLVPQGLVHFGEGALRLERPRSPMWLRVPLLPARAVGAAARRLAFLFEPPAVAVVLALVAVGHASFYLSHPVGLTRALFEPATWLPAMLLFAASALFHELGHAAALAASGRSPGTVGVGLYRVFPVLFSDVSEAWLLPRNRRIAVDLGGVHFQLLFAAGLAAAHALGAGPAVTQALVAIDLAVLLDLNPFLRMDGYWLVSDLTGVRGLRARSLALAADAVRGRRPGRASWPLALYAALSLAYFAALAIWFALHATPRLAAAMRGALRATEAAGGPFARAVTLLVGALVLGAAAAMLVTGLRSAFRFFGRGAGDAGGERD